MLIINGDWGLGIGDWAHLRPLACDNFLEPIRLGNLPPSVVPSFHKGGDHELEVYLIIVSVSFIRTKAQAQCV